MDHFYDTFNVALHHFLNSKTPVSSAF